MVTSPRWRSPKYPPKEAILQKQYDWRTKMGKTSERQIRSKSAGWQSKSPRLPEPPLSRGSVAGLDSDLGDFFEYVREAEIAFVHARHLRQLAAAKARLPGRRDLPDGSFAILHYPWDLPDEGIFCVSHAWLTEHHPDPRGAQLAELVAELDGLGVSDTALVFCDYCSLHQQNSAKSKSEESRLSEKEKALSLEKALGGMEKLFSQGPGCGTACDFGGCKVVVLPNTSYGPPFFDRGWCFFELSVATNAGRVVNAKNSGVRELMRQVPGRLDLVAKALRVNKRFSRQGDVAVVEAMVSRLLRAGQKRAVSAQQVASRLLNTM